MTLTKKQFLKNSLWTFLELSLYPILLVIASPIFIAKLGIEQYGLWMLVMTVTQLVNLLNIGVGDANIRLISHYRAQNEPALIKKVFRYNFSLSILLFIGSALVGYIFSAFNFISFFYKSDNYEFANSILLLASLSWGAKFIEASILAVIKAFERFDINSKLILFSKNSVVLCNLLMVLFGQSLIHTLMLSLFLIIINVCIQLIVLHIFDKNIVSWPQFIFVRNKEKVVNYNFWYWMQSSIALIGFLTDKLAVAWLTDVKTLGYYYIASMIGTNIHNVFLTFGGFIFPRVSFKLSNRSSLEPLYFVSRSLIALPGWLLIICLMLFGDPIFNLWLGNETYLNSIFYIKLYLVFEAGMLLIITPFHFINGSDKLKLNSVFEIVIRLSHFLAMMLGYRLAVVNGIVYGLISSTLINVPFQYYLFNKRIIGNQSNFQFIMVVLPILLLLALILATNIFIKMAIVLAFVFACKFIYFDKGKAFAGNFFSDGRT